MDWNEAVQAAIKEQIEELFKEKNNDQYKIPRMRTVHEAAEEIKKLDANTAVTEYHIRRLVLDGVLPKVKAGNKYLINLDSLLDYLANPENNK